MSAPRRFHKPLPSAVRVGATVIDEQGREAIVISQWGGLIGCRSCARILPGECERTPCCGVLTTTAQCNDVFDLLHADGKVRSSHNSRLTIINLTKRQLAA